MEDLSLKESVMVKVKDTLILYIILCLVGATLEWAYGMLWNLCGQTPWIYPDSILRYTSFEGLPLWGMGGLICVVIYRTYSSRSWKVLAWVIPPLALAALWVIFYGFVIQ
jgi:hypothetical protein